MTTGLPKKRGGRRRDPDADHGSSSARDLHKYSSEGAGDGPNSHITTPSCGIPKKASQPRHACAAVQKHMGALALERPCETPVAMPHERPSKLPLTPRGNHGFPLAAQSHGMNLAPEFVAESPAVPFTHHRRVHERRGGTHGAWARSAPQTCHYC